MAGLGAGGSVRNRGATRIQQRVCGWRRRGVSPRDGGLCRALVGSAAQAPDLLVEFIALHFECPPQLFQPLDLPLEGFKVTVPHRFLDRKGTQSILVIIFPACCRHQSTAKTHLLCHLQKSFVAALPPWSIHGCLLLQLLDLFSHLKQKKNCHMEHRRQSPPTSSSHPHLLHLLFKGGEHLIALGQRRLKLFKLLCVQWQLEEEQGHCLVQPIGWLLSRNVSNNGEKPAAWGELPAASSVRTSFETPPLLSAAE